LCGTGFRPALLLSTSAAVLLSRSAAALASLAASTIATVALLFAAIVAAWPTLSLGFRRVCKRDRQYDGRGQK
jgi:hypothetical protein